MEELINKLEKEFKDFKESIKEKGVDYAIDSAYELTIKQEIIDIIHYDFKFSPIETKALLKEDDLLQDLYDEWLDSDSNFREPIMDSFDERISEISKEYLHKLEPNEAIDLVVKDYFFVNEIQDLMEYGSDSEINMPHISDVYKEIMETLDITFVRINTDEISDGKYQTTIEIDDDFSITVDTKANNGIEIVADNVKSIVDFSERVKEEKEQNIER